MKGLYAIVDTNLLAARGTDPIAYARALNSGLRIFSTSAVTGEGLDSWCEYLVAQAREAIAR